jgi:hypothetical protein
LPGELGIEAVYLESWLRLALGDSAGAGRELDASLNGLPLQRAASFEAIHGPALLVRAMALRASIAFNQRDFDTARRWATAVLDLWKSADPGGAIDMGEIGRFAASK